jgi:predicted helicase
MTTQEYLSNLNTRFKTGISREHSYRSDLQVLTENLCPGVLATNEPARIECGAPDYIITRKNIPVGFIEAKDIGADLGNKVYKEQFDRYRKSLNNLIITDYLTFQLFRDGEFVNSVCIGHIEGKRIVSKAENIADFEAMLKSFCTRVGQTIKSSKKLAEMMAGKARLLANVIEKALLPNENFDQVNESQNNSLREQYHSFQQILIHDINEKGFSDIYAQTIAYGMFAARLHDTSLDSFSRQEAAVLIPKSNPFLRKLFQYVAGYDLDDRIQWIVDDLAEIFRATDVAELLRDFGKLTQQTDPIIHFYETFLSEYDPALRKSRGVWYTPEPVVNFIVRAVDDILKTEFGLTQGIADSSKIKIKVDVQGKKVEQEVHKVQILDPAAGTGTFLAEVIKQIHKKFEGQQGIWNNYVEEQLIPRLNGFEILMASYAMAHLKLDLLLTETGYKPTRDQRFRVYLTNSLEEHHPDTGTLFANWLSTEANEANHIKRDTPVMVVLGNPPYSVSSSNKGEWIQNLISDYKKDLNEKKTNIDDDYIKFTRYGEYFIEKNGEGILAFISNNSFIDGITHRQMRKHLLETFDKIYILDLHGNAKKKETAPDGSKDENVFDIQQGVSINLYVKCNTKKKKQLGQVFHFDLQGLRQHKYNVLTESAIQDLKFSDLQFQEPYYFFVPKNFDTKESYAKHFSLSELFTEIGSGVKTERDKVCIHFNYKEIKEVVNEFDSGDKNFLVAKFNLGEDSRDWKLDSAISDIRKNRAKDLFIKYEYRPFDTRWTFYTGQSRGFIGTPGPKRAYQLINRDNISLVVCRQQSTFNFQHVLLTKNPSDICFLSSQTKETAYISTLYTYGTEPNLSLKVNRVPNLNPDLINRISQKLGLLFTFEKEETEGTFAPIDLLDYIYAVLHSPSYRGKYKEFLKIDFPRIPYPHDVETFWQLANLGSELRQVHLLESSIVEKRITTYPVSGSNLVENPNFENGKVWLNERQYFDLVPQWVWEFYIGGYQPAQKWLKYRKGRELSFEEILHYQKIIVVLAETDRLMKEIDKIEIG